MVSDCSMAFAYVRLNLYSVRDYKPSGPASIPEIALIVPNLPGEPPVTGPTVPGDDTNTIEGEQAETKGSSDVDRAGGVPDLFPEDGPEQPSDLPHAETVFPDPVSLPTPPGASAMEIILSLVCLAAIVVILVTTLRFWGNVGGIALDLRRRLF